MVSNTCHCKFKIWSSTLAIEIYGAAVPILDSIAPKSGFEPTGLALTLLFKSSAGTIVVSIPIPIAGLDFVKLKSLIEVLPKRGLNPV